MFPETQPPVLTPFKAALGSRELFPNLAPFAYLNHAAISPPSVAVQRAAAAALSDYGQHGVSAFLRWHAARARLKGRLAGLIGAQADDIALVPNTTSGLLAVAHCFPWEPGDRVVVFEGEFPTNVTPWQRAAEAYGLELVFVPVSDFAHADGPDFTRFDAALAGGCRLVAVSFVQFQTGLRMPMEAIAKRCKASGAELCVDGIQAVGSIPVDVADIDYLAVGGHKWLMGVEGAGFLYVSPDRVAALRPRLAGWLSHEEAADFLFEPGKMRYDKPIRRAASFLESGAPNTVGYAALEAGVALIEGLGVEQIHAWTTEYLDRLESGLVALGFTSLRLADVTRRSGILSLRLPGDVPPGPLVTRIGEMGVAASTPDGLLRFAPHWPNHPGEVDRVVDAIEKALGE